MNIDDVNQRLGRIYHAISLFRNSNFSDIKTDVDVFNDVYRASIDFNGGKTDAELKNLVFSLISNIASIKNHLKDYCLENRVTFKGEELINSDINVAIIHDLWNIDKHPKYRKSRSGSLPKIINLRQVLQGSAKAGVGGHAIISFDSFTGETKIETGKYGLVNLVISGTIINERGEILGDLVDVCNKALLSWENELIKLGISLK